MFWRAMLRFGGSLGRGKAHFFGGTAGCSVPCLPKLKADKASCSDLDSDFQTWEFDATDHACAESEFQSKITKRTFIQRPTSRKTEPTTKKHGEQDSHSLP